MAYAAVDTWDIAPDKYPVEVSVRRRGVRTPFSGALVQRRQTFSSESAQGQAAVRTFTLNYAGATKTQYNRAMTLWKASGTENLIVRMVGAPFSLRQLANNRYAFKVELEEMLHAP